MQVVQPYIQARHYFGIGSETTFVEAPGGKIVMNAVPSYFNLSGGVRFSF